MLGERRTLAENAHAAENLEIRRDDGGGGSFYEAFKAISVWTENEELSTGSEVGGAGRNRTAVKGFADLCLTTWRPRLTFNSPLS